MIRLIKPLSRWVWPNSTVSRMAPMVQNRLRWARKPIPSPTISDKSKGACMAPGPFRLYNSTPLLSWPSIWGLITIKMRNPNMISGSIHPTVVWVVCVRPRLYPFFKKRVPTQMPKVKPQQAQDGISVTTGKPQHGPPGTSQKDQGADHGKGAQHEADNGRRSDPRPILLEQGRRRSSTRAQNR